MNLDNFLRSRLQAKLWGLPDSTLSVCNGLGESQFASLEGYLKISLSSRQEYFQPFASFTTQPCFGFAENFLGVGYIQGKHKNRSTLSSGTLLLVTKSRNRYGKHPRFSLDFPRFSPGFPWFSPQTRVFTRFSPGFTWCGKSRGKSRGFLEYRCLLDMKAFYDLGTHPPE